MKLSVKTWLAVLVLLAVEAPCAEPHAVSPLTRQVNHFSIGRTSALDALLWLGHDERVCLGIEFLTRELDKTVRVEADQTTVRNVIEKILDSSDAYDLSVLDGVILIRKKGVKPPAWLDHRLPKIELPRMELMWANIRLWMRLESDLDPSQKGFAGDYSATDPIDEVGPFLEHGQTIQQLLVRIVTSSRGASWFPTIQGVYFSFPGSSNHFWTLVTYISPNVIRPK